MTEQDPRTGLFLKAEEPKAVKAAAVEWRNPAAGRWWTAVEVYFDAWRVSGAFLRERCRQLSLRSGAGNEYRYRIGWLELESSDKCEIFKSE